MIRYSDNDATNTLITQVSAAAVPRVADQLGMSSTTVLGGTVFRSSTWWGHSTAHPGPRLIMNSPGGGQLPPSGRPPVRARPHGAVTSTQTWGLRDGLPDDVRVELKNGWGPAATATDSTGRPRLGSGSERRRPRAGPHAGARVRRDAQRHDRLRTARRGRQPFHAEAAAGGRGRARDAGGTPTPVRGGTRQRIPLVDDNLDANEMLESAPRRGGARGRDRDERSRRPRCRVDDGAGRRRARHRASGHGRLRAGPAPARNLPDDPADRADGLRSVLGPEAALAAGFDAHWPSR